MYWVGSMERRVGIVGAGISGLLACKYVAEKGFHPIVLEASSSIGGAWRSSSTLETTLLQTPREAYQFSDFPWPPSVKEDFPSSAQVREYIRSYAEHFDLLRHIKFNSRVVAIDYVATGARSEKETMIGTWEEWGGTGEAFKSGGKWHITVQEEEDEGNPKSTKVYEVEFVMLCVGKFTDVPNVPEFAAGKGPEAFDGDAIHAKDYSAMDNAKAVQYIKGKRVTVVGFGKSALDIAAECAAANGK